MDVQKRDLPTYDVRALELLLDLQESKYQILIPILIRLMMSITLQKTSQIHDFGKFWGDWGIQNHSVSISAELEF